MENFICKVANREELLKRWDYLIKIHPGNNKWVKFKENALKHYDEKSTISYLGFLNDEIICEATAYINDSAFIGDISEPSGLLSDSMAYLAAFRTNKEFQGKGYGTKLMNFIKKYIKEIKCRKMFLITNKSNISACRCYEKAGGVNNSDDEIVYVYK